MIRIRLLTCAVAVPAALAAAACSGPAHHSASGTPSTRTQSAASTPSQQPSATISTAPTSPAPTSNAPVTAAPVSSPTPSTFSTSVSPACAAQAAHTFIHVTAAKSQAGGSLALTGNPTKMICGGPDDFHFYFTTTTETGHLNPGASVKVFPISEMKPVAIAPSKLPSYLATDEDTRVFQVTGPLSAITALQEEFHP